MEEIGLFSIFNFTVNELVIALEVNHVYSVSISKSGQITYRDLSIPTTLPISIIFY